MTIAAAKDAPPVRTAAAAGRLPVGQDPGGADDHCGDQDERGLLSQQRLLSRAC
jgi:hypothetical protein